MRIFRRLAAHLIRALMPLALQVGDKLSILIGYVPADHCVTVTFLGLTVELTPSQAYLLSMSLQQNAMQAEGRKQMSFLQLQNPFLN